MKKILTLLSAVSLTATASASVVACGSGNDGVEGEGVKEVSGITVSSKVDNSVRSKYFQTPKDAEDKMVEAAKGVAGVKGLKIETEKLFSSPSIKEPQTINVKCEIIPEKGYTVKFSTKFSSSYNLSGSYDPQFWIDIVDEELGDKEFENTNEVKESYTKVMQEICDQNRNLFFRPNVYMVTLKGEVWLDFIMSDKDKYIEVPNANIDENSGSYIVKYKLKQS